MQSFSVAGAVIPPMVVNQRASYYKGWYAGVTLGDQARFVFSPKDWADSFSGMEWVTKSFNSFTTDMQDMTTRVILCKRTDFVQRMTGDCLL